jgi:hypothetical protein
MSFRRRKRGNKIKMLTERVGIREMGLNSLKEINRLANGKKNKNAPLLT